MIKDAGYSFIPFIVVIAVLLILTGCGIENRVSDPAVHAPSVSPVAQDEYANNRQEDKNIQRVLRPPNTLKDTISLRFTKLFGDTFVKDDVSTKEVVLNPAGVWLLDEEEGLRLCYITLLASSGRLILHAPDCYGFIERVTSWSMFGPELQLLDVSHTVLARFWFKEKSSLWIGNSVLDGSVLKMSHD